MALAAAHALPPYPWLDASPVAMSTLTHFTRRDIYRVDRLRHIKVAYMRLIDDVPVKKLASRFRISPRTVYYWIDATRGYHDPEAKKLWDMVLAGEELESDGLGR